MSRSRTPSRWHDVLLTALAPAIWGSTYIVTSELLPPGRPFTAALIRTLPAGLLLVLAIRRAPRRQDWLKLATLGALNIGAFQALLFVAAYRLPGGLAAVLGAIQPLLVMALAWSVDGSRPARITLWAAVAGIVGMAMLLLSPQTVFEPVGVAAALLGAACMAAGVWLTQRWQLGLPVLALTGWQLLVGGLMLAPLAWFADAPLPGLSATQWLAYAYLSLAGALLAYALWFRGIARLPAVAVSALGLLSPLTAVLLGWALLSQAMSGTALAGLATVLASVLAVQWTARPDDARPPSDIRFPASNGSAMTHSIRHAIETRASIDRYEPGHLLEDDAIASLVAQATRAPSAYNLQNWRFIAVRSEHAKVRLKDAAYGQRKIVDASAAFIVCGTLDAHAQLATALRPSVQAGIMPQSVADAWVAQASAAHENDPQLQRDEAVRSASLAAMTLMLAAQGMELGSCAMVGFDAARVSREFGLARGEIPVVIVTVGRPARGHWPQKPRKPVSEVLRIV